MFSHKCVCLLFVDIVCFFSCLVFWFDRPLGGSKMKFLEDCSFWGAARVMNIISDPDE